MSEYIHQLEIFKNDSLESETFTLTMKNGRAGIRLERTTEQGMEVLDFMANQEDIRHIFSFLCERLEDQGSYDHS